MTMEPRRFTGDWDDDDIDTALETGQIDIDRREVVHDLAVAERDRRDEKACRLALYPDRRPDSQVTPLGRWAA
jgi:hypothetical protein